MDWISFDKKTARFVHKHPTMGVVCNLVHLELPNSPTSIGDVACIVNHMDKENFLRACLEYGINPADRCALFELAMGLPITDVDVFELEMQSEAVLMTDKKTYKYVKGAFKALYPNRSFSINTSQVSNPASSSFQTQQASKPVVQTSVDITAPRKSGSCKLVWDKADELLRELSSVPSKEQVKARIEQCGETINNSTLSVQFSKWKKSKE